METVIEDTKINDNKLISTNLFLPFIKNKIDVIENGMYIENLYIMFSNIEWPPNTPIKSFMGE